MDQPNKFSATFKKTKNIKFVLLLGFSIFLYVLLYYPVWKNLFVTWYNSEDYSHGFFIIPISAYIVWKKKNDLKNINSKPSWLGLILVLFSLILYLFSYVAEISTMASLSPILVLTGAIIYFYGFRMLKELSLPITFLFFMVPIPEQLFSQLTIPLQLFVTKISVWFSDLLGIPIYREGNIIHLPGQTLQVVNACSGLRSILSILPLAVILGFFTLNSNLLRSLLFLSGIPTAVIINIIRVMLLVLVFHYMDFDLTVGTPHTILGILVFFMALSILLLLKGLLSKWDNNFPKK
ncbi:MAG: exosortase/archaeosortase family protein [Pseudomonadota bacterium]